VQFYYAPTLAAIAFAYRWRDRIAIRSEATRQRIGIKVRITRGGHGVGVPEKLADDYLEAAPSILNSIKRA
jgi:hypothetical protein